MHKGSACHREDVPVTSFNYSVGLGDARVRGLMEQTKVTTSCSNLFAIVGVHGPDGPATNVPINSCGRAISVFTAHWIAHFETCSDILND